MKHIESICFQHHRTGLFTGNVITLLIAVFIEQSGDILTQECQYDKKDHKQEGGEENHTRPPFDHIIFDDIHHDTVDSKDKGR